MTHYLVSGNVLGFASNYLLNLFYQRLFFFVMKKIISLGNVTFYIILLIKFGKVLSRYFYVGMNGSKNVIEICHLFYGGF